MCELQIVLKEIKVMQIEIEGKLWTFCWLRTFDFALPTKFLNIWISFFDTINTSSSHPTSKWYNQAEPHHSLMFHYDDLPSWLPNFTDLPNKNQGGLMILKIHVTNLKSLGSSSLPHPHHFVGWTIFTVHRAEGFPLITWWFQPHWNIWIKQIFEILLEWNRYLKYVQFVTKPYLPISEKV